MSAVCIREGKGQSLLQFVEDFTLIDIETTGLFPLFDSIIEIGAIRYRNNSEVARFHSLISIGDRKIEPFIEHLTGITTEMLKDAPPLESTLKSFTDFVGSDVILGHNISFDINFIYDYCEKLFGSLFCNDYVCTLRLARRATLPVINNQLTTLARHFNLGQEQGHRALQDCETTFLIYNKLREYILANNISMAKRPYTPLSNICATVDKINFDNTFFGKTFVFTGALVNMERKEAAQIVINRGGCVGETVTKATNFLVLGDYSYCSTITEGKSNKHKKAEDLILKGHDLLVIPESFFLSMIKEN